MKIKLYIVSYRNDNDLYSNLLSISNSNISHNLEINIINNYSEMESPYISNFKFNILNNVCRPDFSTGHLSRNWNQAIINGFKDLNNPDCDILMTCQDDTIFEKDWLDKIVKLHEEYSFITAGVGDNFCSYLPEAVKNIGLWDERFCGIGFQEADYFLRARIYNKNSSINDYQHVRVLNPCNVEICNRTLPVISDNKMNFSEFHMKSQKFHMLNKKFFYKKWNINPEGWDHNVPNNSLIENYIYYPYFECNILNLKDKNYFIDGLNEEFK